MKQQDIHSALNDSRPFQFGADGEHDHHEDVGASNSFFDHRKRVIDEEKGPDNYTSNQFVDHQTEMERKTAILQHEFDRNVLPSELKDKARLGGHYLHVKEQVKPQYSPFYVFVSGQIESGQISEHDGLCCKYDFLAGTDWQVVEGNRSGVSQHAYKSLSTNRRVVWNYPFELAFRSYNVSGWPQVVLTFTTRDFLGRDQICGYGTVHIPTQPGTHTRYVNLFQPISSSTLSAIFGWLKGKNPEYISPSELLAKNEGREVTRVQSGGTVKIQFHVTMKNMDDYGIFPFKA